MQGLQAAAEQGLQGLQAAAAQGLQGLQGLQAAAAQGLDPTTLDDATVDQLFAASIEQLPEAQRGRVLQSLGGYDPATQSAEVGAAVLFLDGNVDSDVLLDARMATGDLVKGFEGLDVRSFDFAVLSDEVNTTIQGQLSRLLGLAFHPDYPDDRRVFAVLEVTSLSIVPNLTR